MCPRKPSEQSTVWKPLSQENTFPFRAHGADKGKLGDARWLCCAGMLAHTVFFVKMLAILVCSRMHLAIDCGGQTGTEIALDVSDVLQCEFGFHL